MFLLRLSKNHTETLIRFKDYKGIEKDILVPGIIGRKIVTKIGRECFAAGQGFFL